MCSFSRKSENGGMFAPGRDSLSPIWNGGFSSTRKKDSQRERLREREEGMGRVISDVIEFRSGPFCGAAAVVVKRDGMIPRQAGRCDRHVCRRLRFREKRKYSKGVNGSTTVVIAQY